MKKYLVAVLTLTIVVAFSGLSAAQIEQVNKLDIQAIKKMQIYERNNMWYAVTTMIFVNAAETEIKLRNAEFNASLDSDYGIIKLGKTYLKEMNMAPAMVEDGKMVPAEIPKEIVVEVGPDCPDTTIRLIKLFNVMGDPAVNFKMLLKGTSEVGLRGKRGWIYQKGISVDFTFNPTIQREVLFD